MSRQYPVKGDRHRRCVACLGRTHAEAALSGVDPACGICASLTLAKATKRLALWERVDAERAAPAPSGVITPEGPSAPAALGNVSASGRFTATASPVSLSPSPPPASPRAAGREAVELPPGEDQPELELDFGLDDDNLLDYSDEHDSDEEAMQMSQDVRPRGASPRPHHGLWGVLRWPRHTSS